MAKSYVSQNDARQPGNEGRAKANFFKRSFKAAKAIGKLAGPFFFLHATSVFPGQQAMLAAPGDSTSAKGYKQVNAQIIDTGEKVNQMAQLLAPTQSDKATLESMQKNLNAIKDEIPKLEAALKKNNNSAAKRSLDAIAQSRDAILRGLNSLSTPEGKSLGNVIQDYADSKALSFILPGSTLAKLVSEKKDLKRYYEKASFSGLTVSQLLNDRIGAELSTVISKSQAVTSKMSDIQPQTDVITGNTKQIVPTPNELLSETEKINQTNAARDAALQIVRLSYGLLTTGYANVGDLAAISNDLVTQVTRYSSAKSQLGEQAAMESELLDKVKEYVGDNALYNSIAPIFTTGPGDMSQRVYYNVSSIVKSYSALSEFDTNVKSMILGGMRIAPIIDGVSSSISQSQTKENVVNLLNSFREQMSVMQGSNSGLLAGIDAIITNVNGLQEFNADVMSNIAGQVSGLKSRVPTTTEEASMLQALNSQKSGIISNPMMDFVLARYYGENGEGLASISGMQKPEGTSLREFYFNTIFAKCSDKSFVDAVRSVYLSDKFSGNVAGLLDSRTVFANESSLAATQFNLNTLAQRSVANFDVFSIYGLHQLFNSPRFSTMQPEDIKSVVDAMARMEPKSSYIAAMNAEAFDKIIGIAGTNQSYPLILEMLSKQNLLFTHSGGWQAFENSQGFYSDIKSSGFTGDLGTNIVSTHVTTSRRTIETLTPLDQIVPRYQYLPFFNPAQASLWLSQGQTLFNQQYSGKEDQTGLYNQRAAIDASSFSLMNFLRPPAAPSVMSAAFSPENLGYGMAANDISQQLNDIYINRSIRNISPRIIGGSVKGGLGFDFSEPLQGGVGFDVLQPGGSSTSGYARTLPTSSVTSNQEGKDIVTSEDSRTEMLLQGNKMNYWGQIVGDAFYNSVSTKTSNKEIVQEGGVDQTGQEKSYTESFISSADANLIFGKDANVRVIGSTISSASGDASTENSSKLATYDIWLREKATGSWVKVALDQDQQEQFDKSMRESVNDGLNHTLVEAATSFGGWNGMRVPGAGVENLKQEVKSQSTDNKVAFYFGLYVPGIETATVTASTLTGNRVTAVSKKFGESTVLTAGYFAYNEREAFDRISSGISSQNYSFRRGWQSNYEGEPVVKGGELELLVLDNWKASLFGGSSSNGSNTVGGGSFYNKNVSAGGYFSYEKTEDNKTVLKQAMGNVGTQFRAFDYDVTASGSLMKYSSDRNIYSSMVSTRNKDMSVTLFSSYQNNSLTQINDARIRSIRTSLSSNIDKFAKPNMGDKEKAEVLSSVWYNLSDFVLWDPQEEIRRGFNTMHGAMFNSPKFSAGITSMRMHDGSDLIMPSLSIGENLSIVGGVTLKPDEIKGLRSEGDLKNFVNLKFANNEFGFMGELYQLDGMQYGKLSAGVRTGELSGLGGTFSMSSDSRLYKLDLMYAGENSSIMLNLSGIDGLRARGVSVSKTLSESVDLAMRMWHLSMVDGKGPDSYQFQTQVDFRTGDTAKLSVVGTFEKIKGVGKPNGELKLQYSWGLGF